MSANAQQSGCIVGQAIGDMMGLPFENLTPRLIAKLAKFDRPQFFFGFGYAFGLEALGHGPDEPGVLVAGVVEHDVDRFVRMGIAELVEELGDFDFGDGSDGGDAEESVADGVDRSQQTLALPSDDGGDRWPTGPRRPAGSTATSNS